MEDANGSLAARIERLEQRNQELFAIAVALSGFLMASLSVVVLRRYKVATFSHVTADRISLVQRAPRSGLTPVPDRIVLDAVVTPRGPVLNLYGGRIALYDSSRTSPLLQLEGEWAPLPMRAGTGGKPLGPGEAWVHDRHGLQESLSPMRGRPVLCLYGPDARPGAAITEVGLIELHGAVEPQGVATGEALPTHKEGDRMQ